METIIDKKYLRKNTDHIFVFGDNSMRTGRGGAAYLRNEPNTYGFVTKKYPSTADSAYYRPEEYAAIFEYEFKRLENFIKQDPFHLFLISKIGSGLANKYGIWESVIRPKIFELRKYENVSFLFDIEA